MSCHLTSAALVDAFATVPRERFLPPGPWLIRGMVEGAAWSTESDDPQLVYHNVSVAIDPSRELFNGQPGLIARWLEDIGLAPGQRVVHIGTGTGYFTAVMGHVVGAKGSVHAFEVDPELARRARQNVADLPWIAVTHGDGASGLPTDADIVLVHAGATHVLDEWLDAIADGGRLMAPLTGTMPGMAPTIGKGFMLRATRHGADWKAHISGMVAIYSLVGHRQDAMQAALGKAMMTGGLMKVTRLRRDAHEAGSTCVVHGTTTCLST